MQLADSGKYKWQGHDMDETQIDKLGSKMRDVYADVASEVPVPAVARPKHPSRRLRKNRTFARPPARKAARVPSGAAGKLLMQHPVASLLIAASIGYLLARL